MLKSGNAWIRFFLQKRAAIKVHHFHSIHFELYLQLGGEDIPAKNILHEATIILLRHPPTTFHVTAFNIKHYSTDHPVHDDHDGGDGDDSSGKAALVVNSSGCSG